MSDLLREAFDADTDRISTKRAVGIEYGNIDTRIDLFERNDEFQGHGDSIHEPFLYKLLAEARHTVLGERKTKREYDTGMAEEEREAEEDEEREQLKRYEESNRKRRREAGTKKE